MKALIDADILRYEIGFSSEFKNEEGEDVLLNFDRCIELFEDKLSLILDEVQADDYVLYLTADKYIVPIVNKLRKFRGEEPIELLPNFRENIAVTKPYKGTRKKSKPQHFNNLTAYIIGNHPHYIANGIEADDAMAIEQYSTILSNEGLAFADGFNPDTIICSRDKDLRMIPGWHYSWECGKQASIGPVEVEGLGWLEERPDGKVIGYGDIFFYYQMLIGDAVDNIGGVKGVGPKKALSVLSEARTGREAYEIVKWEYERVYGEDWLNMLQENANLLWMVRELDNNGRPVFYRPPKN